MPAPVVLAAARLFGKKTATRKLKRAGRKGGRRGRKKDKQDEKDQKDEKKERRGCLRSLTRIAIVGFVVMMVLLIAAQALASIIITPTPNPEFTVSGEPDEDTYDELDPDVDLAGIAVRTGIPLEALQAYWSAAINWGVDWAILAAIGYHECNHGRNPNAGCNPIFTVGIDGERGPMQFLGSTWRKSAGQFAVHVEGPPIPRQQESDGYATDGDGNGIADPWVWLDATHAAARLLLENGYESDIRTSVVAYNGTGAGAEAYGDRVMATAEQYRTMAGIGAGGPGGVYRLPLPGHWYAEQKFWFQKTHHDYAASDVPVPTGTEVYAAAAGNVYTASGKCGTGIVIQGDDGLRYIYCHGSRRVVSSGHVEAGQLIMISGNTGNSTGPHLHFAIKLGNLSLCPQFFFYYVMKGIPLDPRQHLPTSGCWHDGSHPRRIADGLPRD